MRLLRWIGAAALLVSAAPTHAEPSLPKGWIAGGPPSTMRAETPPSPRSREALHLSAAPLPPVLAPTTLALDALDTVEVVPTLSVQEVSASNATVSGEAPVDFFVDRVCGRASVSGHAIGTIQVGWVDEPIGPGATGGADLYHVRGSTGGGDGQHRYVRALWETIDRLPDGTLRITQTVGRFDVRACKTTVASRYTAIARPILDGLAFAFRTRCAACSPAGRDDLHVIVPLNGWGGRGDYTHSTVHLAGESGDAMRVRVERFRLQKFAQTFGRSTPPLADGQEMLIGIEAVKGQGEAAPSVIAYATAVRHVGF